MGVNPFDIVKNINEKTPLEFEPRDYSPWMINRALSNTMATVLFANEMNSKYHLDHMQQYAFYYHGVPKGRRFGKWEKASIIHKDVELIAEYFHINNRRAQQYHSLMNEDQLKQLRIKMDYGGRK